MEKSEYIPSYKERLTVARKASRLESSLEPIEERNSIIGSMSKPPQNKPIQAELERTKEKMKNLSSNRYHTIQ